MKTSRLEAFSDGVIAILITIMVLELHRPEGVEWSSFQEWLHHGPFWAYVLSFVYLGIYWNNHHHMLHLVGHVTGGILWANLHLLFWLSLVPIATAWMGANPYETIPAAIYGVVMLLAAIAYYILQQTIIHAQGRNSTLKAAVGKDFKGKISPALYATAIAAAFVNTGISYALYVFV